MIKGRRRLWIAAAAVVISVVVIATVWLSSTPKTLDTTRPDYRITLLRYDNSSASFAVTGTSNPVVGFDNSSIQLGVEGQLADPTPRIINWTGSSAALTYRYENSTFVLLIEDLDGNNMVSNGDTFTFISLEGFVLDWMYSFWLYEPGNTTAYLYGTFYNMYG